MRSACAILVLIAGAASAAEPIPATPPPTAEVAPAKVDAAPAKAKSGKAEKVELSAGTIPDEERWVCEPPAGRPDIFVDVEKKLELERKLLETPSSTVVAPNLLPSGDVAKIDAALEWGRREAERIEALVLARKWDDAITASDNGVKALEKYLANPGVQELTERFKRYKQQAEEAKIYEEAQAKFDALGLKVEGILWSPDGSLAVLSGEPRALKINERSKDCMIINIDTNRVDFLFHYKRRRFEFQRYVGEEVRAARAAR